MIEDFEQTEYFKYLLSNAQELNQERLEFNENISSMLRHRTDDLGTILKCHLVLEYHLDVYLKTAYPTITEWNDARLSFKQKLELINTDKVSLKMYYLSMKCLNTLRNKFAHKIEYIIHPNDYQEITRIMKWWYNALDKTLPTGIRLIEEYTIWVCANINLLVNGIEKHSKSTGIAGYQIWLKEMTKK